MDGVWSEVSRKFSVVPPLADNIFSLDTEIRLSQYVGILSLPGLLRLLRVPLVRVLLHYGI